MMGVCAKHRNPRVRFSVNAILCYSISRSFHKSPVYRTCNQPISITSVSVVLGVIILLFPFGADIPKKASLFSLPWYLPLIKGYLLQKTASYDENKSVLFTSQPGRKFMTNYVSLGFKKKKKCSYKIKDAKTQDEAKG